MTNREALISFIRSNANSEIKSYIFSHTSLDTALYIGSIAETSRETSVSRACARTAFKILQEEGFIAHVQGCVWAVNPELLYNGNEKSFSERMQVFKSHLCGTK